MCQQDVIDLRITDVERATAKRAKSKVIEILGGLQSPHNSRVQGVGIITQNSKLAVSVYVRDDLPGEDPVLPKTVLNVPVIMNKGSRFSASKKEATYKSNREKMFLTVKNIATHLAGKFGKRLGTSWPPSFKLSDKYTVVVSATVPEEQPDSYRITVKVLAGIDVIPPFSADLTMDSMSKAETTGAFIKEVESGISLLNPVVLVS